MFSRFRPHFKSGFLLGYPVMLSMLGQVMTGVADNVMVGLMRDTAAFAACALGNLIFMLPLIFGIGVSYAITPLVSEALGANERDKAADILKHGRLINFICGIAMTGLLYLSLPMVYHINQPVEVAEQAVPFLIILIPSLIPAMTFQTYRQFAEGMHLTRMAMIIVIGCNLLNILLNYFLIFGNGGFPAMGIKGAAISTLTARICMAVGMYSYVYYGEAFRLFRKAFDRGNYSLPLFRKMLHLGIPAGGQFVFEGGAFAVSGVMTGWIGAQALAAHQIALQLATISYMTTSGLGAAAAIRVGYFFGKKDFPQMRTSAYALIILAGLIMIVWAVVFIAFRNELPLFYSQDKEVIALASKLIIIAGLFELADGVQVVCTGALRGMQDVKIPSLLIFIAYWVLSLPIGYLLGFTFGMGVAGIWIALLVGLTLTAIFLLWRFYNFSHRFKQ